MHSNNFIFSRKFHYLFNEESNINENLQIISKRFHPNCASFSFKSSAILLGSEIQYLKPTSCIQLCRISISAACFLSLCFHCFIFYSSKRLSCFFQKKIIIFTKQECLGKLEANKYEITINN